MRFTHSNKTVIKQYKIFIAEKKNKKKHNIFESDFGVSVNEYSILLCAHSMNF